MTVTLVISVQESTLNRKVSPSDKETEDQSVSVTACPFTSEEIVGRKVRTPKGRILPNRKLQ